MKKIILERRVGVVSDLEAGQAYEGLREAGELVVAEVEDQQAGGALEGGGVHLGKGVPGQAQVGQLAERQEGGGAEAGQLVSREVQLRQVDHVRGERGGGEGVVAEPQHLQVLQRGGERVWPSGQLVGAEVELEQVVQVGRQVGRQAGLHQDVPRQVELLETGLAGEQGGGQGGQVVLREDLVAGGVLLQAAVDAQ